MGTPLSPKYIPYTYMDPLGLFPLTCIGGPESRETATPDLIVGSSGLALSA